jgi:hypothetical protein
MRSDAVLRPVLDGSAMSAMAAQLRGAHGAGPTSSSPLAPASFVIGGMDAAVKLK